METTHNTAKNEMEQIFSDRVKIIVDFTTNRTCIFIDNELKVSYDNLSIKEFQNIQERVKEVAQTLKDL